MLGKTQRLPGTDEKKGGTQRVRLWAAHAFLQVHLSIHSSSRRRRRRSGCLPPAPFCAAAQRRARNKRVQVIDFRGLVLALEVTLFSTVLDRIFLCFYTCDSASPVESCSGATRVADGHGMRPCLTRALSLLGCTGSVLSVICHARRCQALGPPMRCWHPMTEPTPLHRHKAPIRCHTAAHSL